MQFDLENNESLVSEPPTIEVEDGLVYKPEHICFEGRYSDELAGQRVKKTWCTILESDFLLIPKTDFQITKQYDQHSQQFLITCAFTSACGRYAFWRLLNEQVPDVQFLLETAHLSHRYTNYQSFVDSVSSGEERKSSNLESLMQQTLHAVTDTLRVVKRLIGKRTK